MLLFNVNLISNLICHFCFVAKNIILFFINFFDQVFHLFFKTFYTYIF